MLREHGIVPLFGDRDDAASLDTLAGMAHDVVHAAPPPGVGVRDTRTKHLIAALTKKKSVPHRLIYISTSGVYGDCKGALVDETQRVQPGTDRAKRRVDAERQLRDFGRRNRVSVSVLRVPGIYSSSRLPLARIRSGTPALLPEEDSYTNHVHVDDLADMVVAALRHGRPNRLYNANDDSCIRMGDYFDLIADRFEVARPPRISRADASKRISPQLLSFMEESRLLCNRRIKRELRLRLRYPDVQHGLADARATP